jgi:hypothetical protein
MPPDEAREPIANPQRRKLKPFSEFADLTGIASTGRASATVRLTPVRQMPKMETVRATLPAGIMAMFNRTLLCRCSCPPAIAG